jgi:zinc transporter ZupT
MLTSSNLRNLSKENNVLILVLQISSIVVIFAMGFIFGMLPLWIKSCRENNNVISIINTFSGGIFLGLGLFHQLPEANEMLEDNVIQKNYPFTYLLAFITYSLILFIEKVATDAHNIGDVHNHKNQHDHKDEEKKNEENKQNSLPEVLQNNSKKEENQNNEIAQIMLKANNEEKANNNIEKRLDTNKVDENDILKMDSNNNNNNQNSNSNSNSEKKENVVNVYSQNSISEVKNSEKEDNYAKKTEKGFKGLLEPIIVLCAIGFHGLFAGISIGIGDTLNDTLIIIIAILAHKWAAALSLGITFVKLLVPKKQFYILIIIFALITPVGTVIGLIVKNVSNDFVEAVFLSVSSGTFFYLSMSEILVEEFEKKENKYIKFIVYVIGCLAISFLVFFE